MEIKDLDDAQIIEAYRKKLTNGAWDSLPNDGYIYQNLAKHMLGAGLDDELHALLTASPIWMLRKLILFGNHESYQADLQLAISGYQDPLNLDDFLKLMALHSARHVFPIFKHSQEKELLRLGRIDDAIAVALASPYPSELKRSDPIRLSNLFSLYQNLQEIHGNNFFYANLVKAIEGTLYELDNPVFDNRLSLRLAVAKLWLEIGYQKLPQFLKEIEQKILNSQQPAYIVSLIEIYLGAGYFEEAEAFIMQLESTQRRYPKSLLIPELVRRHRREEALEIVNAQFSPNDKEKAQAEYAFALWKEGTNQGGLEKPESLDMIDKLSADSADTAIVRIMLYEIDNQNFELAESLIERITNPKKRANWEAHLRKVREQSNATNEIANQRGYQESGITTLIAELMDVQEFELADALIPFVKGTWHEAQFLSRKAYHQAHLTVAERETLLDRAFVLAQANSENRAYNFNSQIQANAKHDFLEKAWQQFLSVKEELPLSIYLNLSHIFREKGDKRADQLLEEGWNRALDFEDKSHWQYSQFIVDLLGLGLLDKALVLLISIEESSLTNQVNAYGALLKYYLRNGDSQAEAIWLKLLDLLRLEPTSATHIASNLVEAKAYDTALEFSKRHLTQNEQIWLRQIVWAEMHRQNDSRQDKLYEDTLLDVESSLSQKEKFSLYHRLLALMQDAGFHDLVPNLVPKLIENLEPPIGFSSTDLEDGAIAYFRLGNFAKGLSLYQHSSPEDLITWYGYYLNLFQPYFKNEEKRLVRESILIRTRILAWVYPQWQKVYAALMACL